MTSFAPTPEPPYYAVIFTSISGKDTSGYQETATRMLELAEKQPGYLGVESASGAIGITVSYWSDLDSINKWRMHAEHQEAQRLGREKWYAAFKTRIAKVERDNQS